MKSYLKVALAPLIGLLILLAAASLDAQYIGGGRPWTAARSAADSTRLDSVATASEAEDTLLHARIDSVRDNASGSITPLFLLAPNTSLEELSDSNVLNISSSADYGSWADSSWTNGTVGYNYTNYLTDTVAVQVTFNNSIYSGMHLTKSMNLAVFSGGMAADDSAYITFNLYVSTASLAGLPTDGVEMLFCVDDYANPSVYIRTAVAKAALVADEWTYVSVMKDAFVVYGGAAWDSLEYIRFAANGTPAAGSIVVLENIQMIRKDPDSLAPNPFQLSGTSKYIQSTGASVTINYELTDTVLASMIPGDYITSAVAQGDTASGLTYVGQTDSTYLIELFSGDVRLMLRGGTKVLLFADNGGVGDSANYSYAVDDTVTTTILVGADSTLTATINISGGGDTTLVGSHSSAAASNKARVRTIGLDRQYQLQSSIPASFTGVLEFVKDGINYFWSTDSTN